MKFIIGSLYHEANTFSPLKADIKHFNNTGFLLYGEEIIDFNDNKSTEIAGFIKVLKKGKHKIIPTISARASCSGKVTNEFYSFLKQKLLDSIDSIKDFDGVLLSLHGSMVAENVDDTEGDLLEAVRKTVKNKPIVITLDLHANVTKKMTENVDAIFGYTTQPHTDQLEIGVKAATHILKLIRGEIQPTMYRVRIPMIVPGDATETALEPMSNLIELIRGVENEKNVISSSIFAVHPWLDIQDTGWSTVVITNNNYDLARSKCNEIAKEAWNLRKKFNIKTISFNNAIEIANSTTERPIIFNNASDAESCGAPGDNPTLLKNIIENLPSFSVALMITDNKAVDQCIQKGVGEEISLELGGKIDTIFGKPYRVNGIIKLISNGKYILKGPVLTGLEMKMGKTIVLEINDKINLVITEYPSSTIGPEQYESVGINPREMKIVEVKSPVMFKASYQKISKMILRLDIPGLATDRFSLLPFKNITRPMYPFDENMKFDV